MSDEKLAAARMSDAMGKLQDALSRLKLAAEELAIVDASLIGSDAHRRLIVESSALRPIETADDIRSHQAQAVEIAAMAADVAKCAKAVKGKAAFLGQALGSVYSSELLEGDRAREKAKDKRGDRALGAVGSAAHRKQAIPATTGAALAQGQVTTTGG